MKKIEGMSLKKFVEKINQLIKDRTIIVLSTTGNGDTTFHAPDKVHVEIRLEEEEK